MAVGMTQLGPNCVTPIAVMMYLPIAETYVFVILSNCVECQEVLGRKLCLFAPEHRIQDAY
jgi:hypothetical protein